MDLQQLLISKGRYYLIDEIAIGIDELLKELDLATRIGVSFSNKIDASGLEVTTGILTEEDIKKGNSIVDELIHTLIDQTRYYFNNKKIL